MREEEGAFAVTRRRPIHTLAITVALLLTAILFGLDLYGPAYLVAARFYVLPLLLVALVGTTRLTTILGLLTASLTVVAIFINDRVNVDYALLVGLVAAVGLFSVVLSQTLERIRRQTSALRSVNEAARLVNEAAGLQETLRSILRLSRDLFGADVALVGLFGASPEGPIKVIGESGEVTSEAEVSLVRSAVTISTGTRSVEIWEDTRREYPGTLASASLLLRGRPIGIIIISFAGERRLGADERGTLELFADQAAVAIENSRLFDRASQASTRLTKLLDLERVIAARLDVDDVVDAVTGAVSQLLDSAVATVMVIDETDGQLRIRGTGKRAREAELPGHTDMCERLAYRALDLAQRAVSTESRYLEAPSVACSTQCRFFELTGDTGYHSVIAWPLSSDGLTLGTLSCFRLHPEKLERPFNDSDISTMEALASMTSIALTNSTELERHRNISDALQKSLLPHAIPRMPELRIGTYYASATSGAFVGGDFFDFIPLSDGRMVIFIGDVCGKGIDAASDTAMAKYMIRMIAEEEPTPGRVLARVNTAVAGAISPGRFITLFYTVFDPACSVLEYASAGHHSPVLIRAADDSQLPMDPGPALGIIKAAQYADHRMTLDVDDVLVMYTDGLVEARQGGELLGAEGVGEFLVSQDDILSIEPRELAARLPQLAMSYSGGHLDDDLAVVVIRRTAVS